MRAPSISTVRFSVLAALILALFATGVVVGAAGGPLLLGRSNSAGSQTTTLSSTSTASTLKVLNPGSGRAVEIVDTNDIPLKITAPSGTAPMSVSNATKVINLHADKLDAYNANGINRVGFAFHDANGLSDPFLAGSDVTGGRLRATLGTPTSGFVIVTGHANLYTYSSADQDSIQCWLEVDDDMVPGTNTWQDIQYDVNPTPTLDLDQTSCDPRGVYVVCSAGSHSVDLEIADLGADSVVFDVTLTAEFVPFDGAGQTAAEACLQGSPSGSAGSPPAK